MGLLRLHYSHLLWGLVKIAYMVGMSHQVMALLAVMQIVSQFYQSELSCYLQWYGQIVIHHTIWGTGHVFFYLCHWCAMDIVCSSPMIKPISCCRKMNSFQISSWKNLNRIKTRDLIMINKYSWKGAKKVNLYDQLTWLVWKCSEIGLITGVQSLTHTFCSVIHLCTLLFFQSTEMWIPSIISQHACHQYYL